MSFIHSIQIAQKIQNILFQMWTLEVDLFYNVSPKVSSLLSETHCKLAKQYQLIWSETAKFDGFH